MESIWNKETSQELDGVSQQKQEQSEYFFVVSPDSPLLEGFSIFATQPVEFLPLELPDDHHPDDHTGNVGQDHVTDQLIPPALSQRWNDLSKQQLDKFSQYRPEVHGPVVSDQQSVEDPTQEV